MLKRLGKTLLAATIVMASAIGIVAAAGDPAFAGTSSCVGTIQDGVSYNFDSYTYSITGLNHSEIDVFTGADCSGKYVLAAIVETNYGKSYYNVEVIDNKCDTLGMKLEMHGYSLATPGCSTKTRNGTPSISSISSPKNYWLYVGAAWNTKAYNLPSVPTTH